MIPPPRLRALCLTHMHNSPGQDSRFQKIPASPTKDGSIGGLHIHSPRNVHLGDWTASRKRCEDVLAFNVGQATSGSQSSANPRHWASSGPDLFNAGYNVH